MSSVSSPSSLRFDASDERLASPIALAAIRELEGKATKPRDPDLDAMRVVGAAGVVWIHAAVVLNDGVGRFAVPMFVIAAVLLTAVSLQRRPEQSTLAFVGKRWLRLYPAFLFWCVVYEAMRQAKWVAIGGLGAIEVEPLRFVGGTYEHLWYVPFLLVATVVAVPLIKLAITSRALRATIGIAALVVSVAWAVCPVPTVVATIDATSPWHCLQPAWWAVPSLLVAISLACATIERRRGMTMPRYAGWAGLAMLVGGSWVNWSVNDQPHLLAVTVSGVGAVWIAGASILPRGFARALAPLGGALGMGIYLCHVLFLRAWVIVAEHRHLPESAMTDVLSFAFALVGAIALSTLLNRSRWTSWTIGA